MTIPTLITSDKSFICSYNIGSNIDHRKSLGVINEITTFTNEYVDGFCWIPVNAGALNDHSWYWDALEKDVVYVKVGVRCSSDGYLHAWLLSSQKVSELILWYTNYNTQHYAVDDKTTLHWCIEKMYQVIFGNITSFVLGNIKFQKYIGSGSTRLYLFGSYSNSLTNQLSYTIDHPTNVQKSSVSWYPNNYTTSFSDYLYSYLHSWSKTCAQGTMSHTDKIYVEGTAFLDDGGSFTDYTTAFNNYTVNDCPLIPITEAINDAFYFGYDEMFNLLSLNIGQAGVGSGITWEYWDNGTWSNLITTDDTNEFTVIGTNTISFTIPTDWTQCSINSTSKYWIRARVTTANYTTQPILTYGKLQKPDYWVNFTTNSFGKMPEHPEPLFFYWESGVNSGVLIPSICDPGDPTTKSFSCCHITNQISGGIGNNSGRSYTLSDPLATACAGDYYDCGAGISRSHITIDMSPNVCYNWVPEDPGPPVIPGYYECCPSFTYDSSVSFTVSAWKQVYPDSIDYVSGEARFPNYYSGDKFLCVYYGGLVYDKFEGYFNNDLDELKHIDFTILTSGSQTNKLLTIFTKHVAIGLLTDATPTLNTKDWIVNWSSADYFSNWQAPDGLASRDPGTTNTIYIRPITRHDEFNIVTDEPVLGGFLHNLQTSNAFLSRDPGTETKIIIPICHQSEFDSLYGLVTSNGFLNRDPGTETKIIIPVSHQTDFSNLSTLLTSNGFLNRDPGTETKIIIPVSHQSEFDNLYNLLRPIIAETRYLELIGDDAEDGISWDNAWKTWTHAMQNTPSEATLIVEEGTYDIGETQVEPDNTIVIYLVKNHIDDVSTVTVTI